MVTAAAQRSVATVSLVQSYGREDDEHRAFVGLVRRSAGDHHRQGDGRYPGRSAGTDGVGPGAPDHRPAGIRPVVVADRPLLSSAPEWAVDEMSLAGCAVGLLCPASALGARCGGSISASDQRDGALIESP